MLTRLSYANVMATLAVFIALGGGAYATHAHRVATADIENRAVATSKLDRHAVSGPKVATNAIGHRHFRGRSITRAKLRNNAVGNPQLAASSVSLTHLSPVGSASNDTPPLEAVPFVVAFHATSSGTQPSGAVITVDAYDGDAPRDFEVIDAWLSVDPNTFNATWQLLADGSPITPISIIPDPPPFSKQIVRLQGFPSSSATVPEGGTLSVRMEANVDGTWALDADLYVLALPL